MSEFTFYYLCDISKANNTVNNKRSGKVKPVKEACVHGKRSEVILFVFNMYLQQGGHRQKRLTTWWKLKQNKKQKLHLLSMQFSHLFSNKQHLFRLKKLYNIKKRTKKEPLILLHKTFRIWNYPNMRYKATPQGQTASYSILLCHQEENEEMNRKISPPPPPFLA